MLPCLSLKLEGCDVEGEGLQSDLDYYKRQFEDLKRQYDDRKSDGDKYLEHSKGLRAFDKEELDKLIKAMCGQDVERDDDAADRINKDLKDKTVDNVNRKWNEIEDEWEALTDKTEALLIAFEDVRKAVKYIPDDESIKAARAELLEQIEKYVDASGKLHGNLNDDFKSLSNVKEGTMNGANNPRIRAALDHGKKKHIEMQSYYSCHEKEVVLSSGRPDCILFNQDDCKVIEFKPDTYSTGQAEDEAELYISDVVQKFKDDSRASVCKKNSDNLPIFTAQGQLYPACS